MSADVYVCACECVKTGMLYHDILTQAPVSFPEWTISAWGTKSPVPPLPQTTASENPGLLGHRGKNLRLTVKPLSQHISVW